ncbi:MAG: DedA family protein [Desulfobacterales bacterium]|nr:DedA family protein [Desulfobacterales bacterium]MBF0397638.1 DedA family protein [Desulfobacterales bacterium]
MEEFISLFLHIDKHLDTIIKSFGIWSYVILFTIIFCETGLVVTPILPGDSLLFAIGTFAALGSLDIWIITILLSIAAILGDTLNYWVGHFLGPKVFNRENSRLLNKKHLDKTHEFYERHGGKTIIIARFVPIIRTFAPFVAGIGKMSYAKFIAYNIIGGILWITLFTFGGYLFGNIPIVKKNFSIVMVVIVIISVMPIIIEFIKEKYYKVSTN